MTVGSSGHAFGGIRRTATRLAYRPGSYRQTAQARLWAAWPSGWPQVCGGIWFGSKALLARLRCHVLTLPIALHPARIYPNSHDLPQESQPGESWAVPGVLQRDALTTFREFFSAAVAEIVKTWHAERTIYYQYINNMRCRLTLGVGDVSGNRRFFRQTLKASTGAG